MEREEIIRRLIKEKGMSLKAFAASADIPYTTLHSMLDRGIGKAAVDNVIKVCKELGISIEELEEMSNDINAVQVNTLAAHATNDLTEEEQKQVLDFVKFIKSQRDLNDA